MGCVQPRELDALRQERLTAGSQACVFRLFLLRLMCKSVISTHDGTRAVISYAVAVKYRVHLGFKS